MLAEIVQGKEFRVYLSGLLGVHSKPDPRSGLQLEALRQSIESKDAEAFIQAHPDFQPSPENQQHLQKHLDDNKLDLTKRNLDAAWRSIQKANIARPARRTSLSESQSARIMPQQDELSNRAALEEKLFNVSLTQAREYISNVMFNRERGTAADYQPGVDLGI